MITIQRIEDMVKPFSSYTPSQLHDHFATITDPSQMLLTPNKEALIFVESETSEITIYI